MQKDASDENNTIIVLEVENPQITGSFNIKIIKTNEKTERLNDVKFKLTIMDNETNKPLKTVDGEDINKKDEWWDSLRSIVR